jgi:hypothetical protein
MFIDRYLKMHLITVCNQFSYKFNSYTLDLGRRKWQEAGEDCIMRSFITYMLYQMLSG